MRRLPGFALRPERKASRIGRAPGSIVTPRPSIQRKKVDRIALSGAAADDVPSVRFNTSRLLPEERAVYSAHRYRTTTDIDC